MPARPVLASILVALLATAALAEMGPCKPDGPDELMCGSGPGAARVIEDTVSPDKRFALAWRLDGADPTEPPVSDDIEILVVRLADGAVLARAKTEYWHTGSMRANRLEEEASWSPDSRFVVRAFQQRFDTERLDVFALDAAPGNAGPSARMLDLKAIVEPAVRERLRRRARKGDGYVLRVHGGKKLKVDNAGRIRLNVMMWVPKDGPEAHYDATVQLQRGKDGLRALVTSVKPAATAREGGAALSDRATMTSATLSRLRRHNLGRIADLLVECDGLSGETSDNRRPDCHALAEFERRHLVLAAGLEPRLDLAKPLAAPEAEQHALVLGADQQHRAVRRIDEMAPFHRLVESRGLAHGAAQHLDAGAPPAGERADVGVGIGGRHALAHGKSLARSL